MSAALRSQLQPSLKRLVDLKNELQYGETQQQLDHRLDALTSTISSLELEIRELTAIYAKQQQNKAQHVVHSSAHGEGYTTTPPEDTAAHEESGDSSSRTRRLSFRAASLRNRSEGFVKPLAEQGDLSLPPQVDQRVSKIIETKLGDAKKDDKSKTQPAAPNHSVPQESPKALNASIANEQVSTVKHGAKPRYSFDQDEEPFFESKPVSEIKKNDARGSQDDDAELFEEMEALGSGANVASLLAAAVMANEADDDDVFDLDASDGAMDALQACDQEVALQDPFNLNDDYENDSHQLNGLKDEYVEIDGALSTEIPFASEQISGLSNEQLENAESSLSHAVPFHDMGDACDHPEELASKVPETVESAPNLHNTKTTIDSPAVIDTEKVGVVPVSQQLNDVPLPSHPAESSNETKVKHGVEQNLFNLTRSPSEVGSQPASVPKKSEKEQSIQSSSDVAVSAVKEEAPPPPPATSSRIFLLSGTSTVKSMENLSRLSPTPAGNLEAVKASSSLPDVSDPEPSPRSRTFSNLDFSITKPKQRGTREPSVVSELDEEMSRFMPASPSSSRRQKEKAASVQQAPNKQS